MLERLAWWLGTTHDSVTGVAVGTATGAAARDKEAQAGKEAQVIQR